MSSPRFGSAQRTASGADDPGRRRPRHRLAAELNADRTAAELGVLLEASPSSDEALDLVEAGCARLRHASGAAERVLVGGRCPAFADIREAVSRDDRVVYCEAGGTVLLDRADEV